MNRLKFTKTHSHDDGSYKVGELVDIEDDALTLDLLSKGVAVLDGVGDPGKDPSADPAKGTLTLDDVTKAVDARLSEIAGKVKRPNIAVGKNRAEDDPARGYKCPQDFFLDVLNASKGLKPTDLLAPLRILKTIGSDEQSEFADPFGGFLLPIQFMPDLLRIAPEADPTVGRTRSFPMSVPVIKWPVRVDKNHSTSVSGGLTVKFREEAGDIATSRVKLEQVTLTAHTLIGAAFTTEELLTDSPISIAAMLADGFRDEMVATLLTARLFGTGVGELMGVMNSPSLITVPKETGQAAGTIVYENVVNMYARLWGKGEGVWIANHAVLPQLMQMNQTVGVGGVPAWQISARDGAPNRLMGLPIFFSEFPKTIGTVGDIILGNWREYLEGTLQPLQSAESMHVRFLNHERAFKFWLRIAGAPWWNAPLTPKNSAPTLSPFLALATRS